MRLRSSSTLDRATRELARIFEEALDELRESDREHAERRFAAIVERVEKTHPN